MLQGGAKPSAADRTFPRQTIIIAFTNDTTLTTPTLERYGIFDVLPKPVSVQALR